MPVLVAMDRSVFGETADLARDFEEVVVLGKDLPTFQNQPSARIHLYRYDASSGSFQPIPFQIDEVAERIPLESKCSWQPFSEGFTNCEGDFGFTNSGTQVASSPERQG